MTDTIERPRLKITYATLRNRENPAVTTPTLAEGTYEFKMTGTGVFRWQVRANFPTTTGAFATSYSGGVRDAFVTKLSPTAAIWKKSPIKITPRPPNG